MSTTSFEKNRAHIVSLLNERYPNGLGCEVGVLRGEFSKHLLSNWNCKKLYLVDCWEEHPTDYDEIFHNHQNNFKIMQQTLLPFSSRYEICKGYSDKIVHSFQEEMFDFIYIDANHSYQGCKLDLDLYWSKLKKGGILMGDDYHLNDIEDLSFNDTNVTFGVTKAVREFCKEKHRIFDTSYTADWVYPSHMPARNFVIQK
jgi:predicted O-methyltransferase YrrM